MKIDVFASPKTKSDVHEIIRFMDIVRNFNASINVDFDCEPEIAISDDFIDYKNLLITGMKKCGKTTFMKQLIESTLNRYKNPKIIIIDPDYYNGYPEYECLATIITDPVSGLNILDEQGWISPNEQPVFIFIDSLNQLIFEDVERLKQSLLRLKRLPNIQLYVATSDFDPINIPQPILDVFPDRIMFVADTVEASKHIIGTDEAVLLKVYQEFILYSNDEVRIYKTSSSSSIPV